MRICKSQTGYALALLMWMIAGMSLLVMAVIHFAQDDIGLAEQRLNEAKSDALARGVAMLALRDEALAPYLDEAKPDGDGPTGRNSGNRTDNKRVDGALSSRRYELDGHVAVATVHPASGFVSLNGASGYELGRLFTEMGGASKSEVDALVQGVMDYRNQRSANSASLQDFMGFRSREELLSVRGMRKGIYDRVKDYVQPYEATTLNLARAPDALRSVFPNGSSQTAVASGGNGARAGGLSRAAPAVDGLVTFEALNRQRAAAMAADTVMGMSVDIRLANGQQMAYRVWVAGDEQRVLHSERLAVRRKREEAWR